MLHTPCNLFLCPALCHCVWGVCYIGEKMINWVWTLGIKTGNVCVSGWRGYSVSVRAMDSRPAVSAAWVLHSHAVDTAGSH